MIVEIVLANSEDAEAIRSVYADAYRSNRDLGFPASAETALAEDIKQWILNDRVWIGRTADRIVGAIRLRTSANDFPTLSRFGVASEFKGQGIGHVLMQTVESFAKAEGHAGIRLSVAAKHPHLVLFYERRGYTIVGPRQPPSPLYEEVIMVKIFESN